MFNENYLKNQQRQKKESSIDCIDLKYYGPITYIGTRGIIKTPGTVQFGSGLPQQYLEDATTLRETFVFSRNSKEWWKRMRCKAAYDITKSLSRNSYCPQPFQSVNNNGQLNPIWNSRARYSRQRKQSSQSQQCCRTQFNNQS